ncbi:MAG: NAD(P)H-quinone oxidoreductase subunit N [Calothrix sp. MO_167.B42]|nr:NAD(P)H-quinone oxidoreductase subunit N [Calothrix sp. MO_167.B42]
MNLPQSLPQIKVVVERGGDRAFRWKSLANTMAIAS